MNANIQNPIENFKWIYQRLPGSLCEQIILLTGNAQLAALFRSTYCWKKLTNDAEDKNDNTVLNMVRLNWFRQVHWLYRTNLVSNTTIYGIVMWNSTDESFSHYMNLIPMSRQKEDLNAHFQDALNGTYETKCNLILDTGRIPTSVFNLSPLHAMPDLALRLAEILPPQAIYRRDSISAAIKSGNLSFLMKADKHVEVRRLAANNDYQSAASKGYLSLLQWLHTTCKCSKDNYIRCMFDNMVYYWALDVVKKWIMEETNCVMDRKGYERLGRLRDFQFNSYGGYPGIHMWFK